jgi:hypothetical protein
MAHALTARNSPVLFRSALILFELSSRRMYERLLSCALLTTKYGSRSSTGRTNYENVTHAGMQIARSFQRFEIWRLPTLIEHSVCLHHRHNSAYE